MTQNQISAEEINDPRSAPGLGTQLLALVSATAVGVGIYVGSLVLGIALVVIVLITMNVDAGVDWIARFRRRAAARDSRNLRHLLNLR